MTENTPTPAPPLEPERLLAELDRRAALPKDVSDRAFTIGIRWIFRQAAALIRSRTAERDALAAILAEAPHASGCHARHYSSRVAEHLCDCWKSKLPADALAARDARSLDRIISHLKSTVRLGLGLTEEQKQDRRNIIDWLEADRIEREAQR